ncbi:hypothetical protein F0562_012804 [Nyssa sinensis]|uniref:Uncharacterized protein n=1 Tax=Nyssa sinensis TaxID=561372 RepID=A0A5J4ZWU1_9ASTE|nr:hypothetical protein F0562_012804 [Nyssa sinensis]
MLPLKVLKRSRRFLVKHKVSKGKEKASVRRREAHAEIEVLKLNSKLSKLGKGSVPNTINHAKDTGEVEFSRPILSLDVDFEGRVVQSGEVLLVEQTSATEIVPEFLLYIPPTSRDQEAILPSIYVQVISKLVSSGRISSTSALVETQDIGVNRGVLEPDKGTYDHVGVNESLD